MQMADQGDRPISRSSHKKTGKSGKQPAVSRLSQDTMGFPQLPPIVSIPPLRDEVVDSTSSISEEFIVTDTPPISRDVLGGSGSTGGGTHQQQQSHPSSSRGAEQQ